MSSDDVRSQLRGAVYRGDGAALVELLGRAWPDDAQQMVSDGLGSSLRDRVEGAASLAATCLTALRVRAWERDGELADSLEAALDPSRTPALIPFPVDLEELAMSLEGDLIHGGGRVDLRPVKSGHRLRSNMPRRRGNRTRPMTIGTDGCGSTRSARTTDTGTCSSSSLPLDDQNIGLFLPEVGV